MKIAILGAGAMGMLIGGYLSKANEVTLIDVNADVVEHINAHGVTIHEKDGTVYNAHPHATVETKNMEPVDLVIVFVKAMFSEAALAHNKGLIDAHTYLMTLQNGAGHEQTLLRFAERQQVVIGTTQHNSSVVSLGEIRHGGSGHTYIGGLDGCTEQLECIAKAFEDSGLSAGTDANVQKLIWNKMFTNVSASVLTGILQCPLGFISRSAYAWNICEQLIREAAAVAAGDGMLFDAEEKLQEVRAVCDNAPDGYTSIYADLKNKRKSEVDTISGAVVQASKRNGVAAPTHQLMVHLVHAMEDASMPK